MSDTLEDMEMSYEKVEQAKKTIIRYKANSESNSSRE